MKETAKEEAVHTEDTEQFRKELLGLFDTEDAEKKDGRATRVSSVASVVGSSPCPLCLIFFRSTLTVSRDIH